MDSRKEAAMHIVSTSLQMAGISRQEVQTRRTMRMVVHAPVEEENSSQRGLKGRGLFFKSAPVPEAGLKHLDLDMSKRLVQMILNALTGKKPDIPFFRPEPVAEFPRDVLSGGPGSAFHIEETIYTRMEQESIFMAEGEVMTADGRKISFSVMQMQSRKEESFVARQVNFVDPLVISLSGPVTMGDARFTFDLTGDGKEESLAMPSKGAGFLFLDKNDNGRVDDGSELFGTSSGDGFADLAAYDSDGNGWIDSGDPVFSKLRIWHPEDGTNGRGKSLSDMGIGAIGLFRVATPMDVGGEKGGRIQSSGIVLTETGRAGTVHHLDLKV